MARTGRAIDSAATAARVSVCDLIEHLVIGTDANTLFVGFVAAPPGRAARDNVAAHATATDAFDLHGHPAPGGQVRSLTATDHTDRQRSAILHYARALPLGARGNGARCRKSGG